MAAQPQENNPVVSILNTIRELNQLKDIDMILDRILFECRLLSQADAGSIFLRKKKSCISVMSRMILFLVNVVPELPVILIRA